MPATASGRGAQVILTGDAQAAARGAYAGTLEGNAAARSALVLAGLAPDGSTPDGSTLTGMPARGDALDASEIRAIPRAPSLLRSWVPNANLRVLPPAAICTLSSLWGLESDFDLVRLVYNNPSATPFTVVKAIVAASSALGDTHSPVNAAGANDFTLFQTVYFNNAGADVSPQDQTLYGSGTSTLTVAANAGVVAQPPLTFSDWVRAPSLARTDGGSLSLLAVRNLTDATATFQTCILPLSAVWDPLAQGRTLKSTFKNGVDNVTVPSLMSAPAETVDLAPMGVQYMTRDLGFTVLIVGDSLSKGQGSSGSNTPWGFLSCLALSSPTRPISVWNQGWTGQTSPNFWFDGYNAFKASQPQVVTIAVYSPNDGLTQATADSGWSRAMDLAQYVMKQGAVPVLMGPCPWSGISTGAQEAARLSVRTRMLQAGANGMNVLDWEAVIGTGASPNRIQTALIAADNQHPNDAGNALMDSAVFRPVLRNILRA